MTKLVLLCFIALSALPGRPLFADALHKNGFRLDSALIKPDEILAGGPPKDGIPAIDHPRFIDAKQAKKIFSSNEYAIFVENNGVRKAYPISILNWHEIVNDQINKTPVVITFCPLCGTGIVFHSQVAQMKMTFGVSGLLYQSDVLLYDRQTNSLWSQLMLKAVSGKMKGKALKVYPSTHGRLLDELQTHPRTQVLSTKTGYRRNYSASPYGDYEKNSKIYFPVKHREFGENPKTWSLLIRGNEPLIIPIDRFSKPRGQQKFRVAGDGFTIRYDKEKRELHCLENSERCLTGYFFALKTFYPEAEIYTADALNGM